MVVNIIRLGVVLYRVVNVDLVEGGRVAEAVQNRAWLETAGKSGNEEKRFAQSVGLV